MNEFFTWALLASFAGATGATAIITQFVKGALSKIPTQLVSYVIALIILFLATMATKATTGWQDWAILPLNAVLVSLASNGGFHAVSRVKNTGGSHN